jgi:8-oxo-dGTP diphosphatase
MLVRAAGGIVTRAGPDGRPEVLLVHRPRYDDWSLPKGKARRDESDRDCALREVEEETGLACEVGDEVAVTEYTDASGRPKVVRYFAMAPPAAAEATPQNEIDGVRWLEPRDALELLSYDRDAEVVRSALGLEAD